MNGTDGGGGGGGGGMNNNNNNNIMMMGGMTTSSSSNNNDFMTTGDRGGMLLSHSTSGTAIGALCASCDRCRARKTKCDGQRPCGNCASKYMKKHKLISIDGIDPDEFDCIYSPAKRRGPVPRAQSSRKNSEMRLSQSGNNVSASQQFASQQDVNVANMGNAAWPTTTQQVQGVQQQQVQQPAVAVNSSTTNAMASLIQQQMQQNAAGGVLSGGGNTATLQKQLELLQQLQMNQQQQQQQLNHQQQQQQMGSSNNLTDAQQQQQLQLQQQIQQQLQQQVQQQQQQQQQMIGNVRPHEDVTSSSNINNSNNMTMTNDLMASLGVVAAGGGTSGGGGSNIMDHAQLQQQQLQQHVQQQLVQQQQQQQQLQQPGQHRNQRIKRQQEEAVGSVGIVPRTITLHTHLLERSDPVGLRLYSFYKLSIDELFRLPSTPTDEEYCTVLQQEKNNNNTNTILHPSQIPGSHLAALSAARFAEVALGALVHNQISLGMELCNAVVHCLRESVSETTPTVSTTVSGSGNNNSNNGNPDIMMYQVAKAYFLLGVFRACRGDMRRYFQYRRVCMTYLANMENDDSTAILLASISYLDSWAYMIYNANESALPIDGNTIPPPSSGGGCHGALVVGSTAASENELKFQVKTDPNSIACHPRNHNWIQGPPPVYLNNEAPLHARALDALSCAVRTCCDQANSRFAAIAKEAGMDAGDDGNNVCTINAGVRMDNIDIGMITPTTAAVMSHEDELCSRNLVLSAFTLIQHYESTNKNKDKNEGQHLVISAMDAFLENSSDDDGSGGFTDSQIQSLLAVCNTAIENPLLLHHAGPTYHMVTNAAVLLCHLLNGMYAMKHTSGSNYGPMESTMFEEVLDTYVSVRKLLTIHRRKLPVKLRCHGLPRPSFLGLGMSASSTANNDNNNNSSTPLPSFVDLGETLLCACRGCQGFVLMACSPCVAAERARDARLRMAVESAQEAEAVEFGCDLDRELDMLGEEFNVDDDALLNMISTLITN